MSEQSSKMRGKLVSVKLMITLLFLLKISDKYVKAQSTPIINVLHVNDVKNTVADKAMQEFSSYVTKSSELGIKVVWRKVAGNRTDPDDFIDRMCTEYEEMVSEKKNPFLVLDTTMDGVISEAVKSFTVSLSLPTVSGSFGQTDDMEYWQNLNNKQKQYLIHVIPPGDLMVEIVKTIVITQKMENAAILHDSRYVMDHKYGALLENVANRHVIAEIEERKLKKQIRQLIEVHVANFFIVGSVRTISKVLDTAEALNLFQKRYAWYAITQDKADLYCKCNNATIVYIKPGILDISIQNRLYRLKATSLLSSESPLASAFYFELAFMAVHAMKSATGDKVWNDVKYIKCKDIDPQRASTAMSLDLKRYITKVPNVGTFKIIPNGESYMSFKMDINAVTVKKGNLHSSQIGEWHASMNSNLGNLNLKPYLAETVYRVVAALQRPFIVQNANKEYSGYCIDLINEIAKRLNFKYELQVVDTFGYMDDNGTWNGVIRELLDKNADIGVGSMSVMAEREYVVDFTVPFYDLVGMTMMLKIHQPVTALFTFLTVLETDIWLCIIGLYFFCSFLAYVYDRLSPFSYKNNIDYYIYDIDQRNFNLKECLWFCITSLTPQGGGDAPKNLSGRIVAGMWWLFGFIIIASYTANLAAYLTASRLENPVDSVDDLSKQYKVQYAPLNNSPTMQYFKRMADIETRLFHRWKDMSLNDSLPSTTRAKLSVWEYPLTTKFIKMWEYMKESRLPQTFEEAVKRVRASKTNTEAFVYIGDSTDIRYMQLTSCDLKMVGEEFSRKPYALAVQQGSPLKDQLNTVILTLLNDRSLERFKERWWSQNPNVVNCPKIDNGDGIGMNNIGGVFVVVLIGIFFATISLAIEYNKNKKLNAARINAEVVLQDSTGINKAATNSENKLKSNNTAATDQSDGSKMVQSAELSRF